jgi:hypothetical protein
MESKNIDWITPVITLITAVLSRVAPNNVLTFVIVAGSAILLYRLVKDKLIDTRMNNLIAYIYIAILLFSVFILLRPTIPSPPPHNEELRWKYKNTMSMSYDSLTKLPQNPNNTYKQRMLAIFLEDISDISKNADSIFIKYHNILHIQKPN